LRASLKLGIPIHTVHGNNIGDPVALHNMMTKTRGRFTCHGQDALLELGGRRIFATHMPWTGVCLHRELRPGTVAYGGGLRKAGLDGHVIQPKKLQDIAVKVDPAKK
jgi:hypothetical protein